MTEPVCIDQETVSKAALQLEILASLERIRGNEELAETTLEICDELTVRL